MARRVRSTALVVFLAVAAAACSSGGDDPVDEPTPTESAAPTVEPDPDPTETEPEDPFAIPDEIDETYAQAVVDELLELRTQALRLAVAANGEVSLPAEVAGLVGASHSGPERLALMQELESYLAASNLDEVFVQPDEMRPQRFEPLQVVESNPDCIVLTGIYVLEGTALQLASEPPYSVFSLARADEGAKVNPTPWTLHDLSALTVDEQGTPAPRQQVEAATFEEVAGVVSHTCGTG